MTPIAYIQQHPYPINPAYVRPAGGLEDDEDDHRECSRCGEIKPEEDFYRNYKHCKACHALMKKKIITGPPMKAQVMELVATMTGEFTQAEIMANVWCGERHVNYVLNRLVKAGVLTSRMANREKVYRRV